MARVERPLLGKKDASRRSLDDTGVAARGHLRIVRSSTSPTPMHRGMWADDPLGDPSTFTTPADWPADSDFDPLIEQAAVAGDHLLVAQLKADRRYCGRARARLQQAKRVRDDSSA